MRLKKRTWQLAESRTQLLSVKPTSLKVLPPKPQTATVQPMESFNSRIEFKSPKLPKINAAAPPQKPLFRFPAPFSEIGGDEVKSKANPFTGVKLTDDGVANLKKTSPKLEIIPDLMIEKQKAIAYKKALALAKVQAKQQAEETRKVAAAKKKMEAEAQQKAQLAKKRADEAKKLAETAAKQAQEAAKQAEDAKKQAEDAQKKAGEAKKKSDEQDEIENFFLNE